jgi:phosphoribosylamine--glycine ligase
VTDGVPIDGLDAAGALPGVDVYHAATAVRDGRLVTAGGRVLTVVGRGATFEDAIARAYEGVGRIRFDGVQYRRDIGQKALAERSR